MQLNNQKNRFCQKRGLSGLSALQFKQLIRLKEINEQTEFNRIMERLLPDVAGYIARRLSSAVKNGDLPPQKYKVADFTDELYLKAYDQINEVSDEKELHPWLFIKADELLEETIRTEDKDASFFENIDRFTKAEWKQMQEEFSADVDGELRLLEEFDDVSYPKYEYHWQDALVTDNSEEKYLEALDSGLTNSEIHQHIDMVLHRLPTPMRSIYDLAVHQRFSPNEIAKIKRISVQQVKCYLKQAKDSIRKSLENRFRKHSA